MDTSSGSVPPVSAAPTAAPGTSGTSSLSSVTSVLSSSVQSASVSAAPTAALGTSAASSSSEVPLALAAPTAAPGRTIATVTLAGSSIATFATPHTAAVHGQRGLGVRSRGASRLLPVPTRASIARDRYIRGQGERGARSRPAGRNTMRASHQPQVRPSAPRVLQSMATRPTTTQVVPSRVSVPASVPAQPARRPPSRGGSLARRTMPSPAMSAAANLVAHARKVYSSQGMRRPSSSSYSRSTRTTRPRATPSSLSTSSNEPRQTTKRRRPSESVSEGATQPAKRGRTAEPSEARQTAVPSPILPAEPSEPLVPTPSLASDVVSTPSLASDVVPASSLASDVVPTPSLASDVVTTPRLASDVVPASLASEVVPTPRLASDVVPTPSLASDVAPTPSLASDQAPAEPSEPLVTTSRLASDVVPAPSFASDQDPADPSEPVVTAVATPEVSGDKTLAAIIAAAAAQRPDVTELEFIKRLRKKAEMETMKAMEARREAQALRVSLERELEKAREALVAFQGQVKIAPALSPSSSSSSFSSSSSCSSSSSGPQDVSAAVDEEEDLDDHDAPSTPEQEEQEAPSTPPAVQMEEEQEAPSTPPAVPMEEEDPRPDVTCSPRRGIVHTTTRTIWLRPKEVDLGLKEVDPGQVVVISPSGQPVAEAMEKRLPNGNLGLHFIPTETGVHVIYLYDYPRFHVHVEEHQLGLARETFGTGLAGGVAGQYSTFRIKYQGYGNLSFMVEGPGDMILRCQARKQDDVCIVLYKPSVPGTYRFTVTFAGREIPGSPFKPVVREQDDDEDHRDVGPAASPEQHDPDQDEAQGPQGQDQGHVGQQDQDQGQGQQDQQGQGQGQQDQQDQQDQQGQGQGPAAQGPAAQGPAAQGPAAQDHAAQGPAAQAHAAQGPAAQDQAAQGPAAQGPAAQGPAAQAHAAQGPAAQGPAAQGPAAQGQRRHRADRRTFEEPRRSARIAVLQPRRNPGRNRRPPIWMTDYVKK